MEFQFLLINCLFCSFLSKLTRWLLELAAVVPRQILASSEPPWEPQTQQESLVPQGQQQEQVLQPLLVPLAWFPAQ